MIINYTLGSFYDPMGSSCMQYWYVPAGIPKVYQGITRILPAGIDTYYDRRTY